MIYLKLVDIKQTCLGCPTIFEGITEDGDKFYFRYRGGKMQFRINDYLINAVDYGDSLDGVCSWEEVKQVALDNGLQIDDGSLQ